LPISLISYSSRIFLSPIFTFQILTANTAD
jgi:hypothetical protein